MKNKRFFYCMKKTKKSKIFDFVRNIYTIALFFNFSLCLPFIQKIIVLFVQKQKCSSIISKSPTKKLTSLTILKKCKKSCKFLACVPSHRFSPAKLSASAGTTTSKNSTAKGNFWRRLGNNQKKSPQKWGDLIFLLFLLLWYFFGLIYSEKISLFSLKKFIGFRDCQIEKYQLPYYRCPSAELQPCRRLLKSEAPQKRPRYL